MTGVQSGSMSSLLGYGGASQWGYLQVAVPHLLNFNPGIGLAGAFLCVMNGLVAPVNMSSQGKYSQCSVGTHHWL